MPVPFRLSYGEDLLTELERVAEYYNGRVARFLGLTPVPEIKLVWGSPDMEFAGYSQSYSGRDRSIITINPGFRDGTFDTHPRTLRALMAHEVTHSVIFHGTERIAAQGMPSPYGEPGTIPWAFQEGMATWVSKSLVLPRGDRRVDWALLQQPGMDPKREGYDSMAGYLQEIDDENPGVTKRIARQLAYGTFTTDTFRQATGKTIHDSLKDYKANQTPYVISQIADLVPTTAPAWTRMQLSALTSMYRSGSQPQKNVALQTAARMQHQQLRGPAARGG
jgi:hypothetical protein